MMSKWKSIKALCKYKENEDELIIWCKNIKNKTSQCCKEVCPKLEGDNDEN